MPQDKANFRLGAAGVLLSLSMLLGGCADSNFSEFNLRSDKIVPEAGDAVTRNKIVQTIDPWPIYSEHTRIATDGKRMNNALDKYHQPRSTESNSTKKEGTKKSENPESKKEDDK